jgi:hypothetical protein
MSASPNRAPRLITIAVAVVLIGVGALGTFADVLPEKVGVWSYVAATAVMLVGVFLRRF